MIRRPRAKEPAEEARALADILWPLLIYPWSNMAMHYLGVPITVSQHFVVVQDKHYEACAQRLVKHGLIVTVPNRGLHPDILATLPDADSVMAQIMAGYASLDKSATVFNYPDREEQVVLVPNSFACLPLGPNGDDLRLGSKFDIYGNIHYPLERALIESFVKCAQLESYPGSSEWGMSLMTSISTMLRYLDIENDILDSCTDRRSVEWFSENFGRGHDAKYGLPDYRISKRIHSGKELPVNSRGHALA